VAAHLEVILRATAIFVADVAFANVARKYDDFLRSMENACLTMTHDTPYRSSLDAASKFQSRAANPITHGASTATAAPVSALPPQRRVDRGASTATAAPVSALPPQPRVDRGAKPPQRRCCEHCQVSSPAVVGAPLHIPVVRSPLVWSAVVRAFAFAYPRYAASRNANLPPAT
jgi:hypothetical protein